MALDRFLSCLRREDVRNNPLFCTIIMAERREHDGI
nr:MAG TPA: hypothetical protein [Caudoviricetes sp.]